MGLKRKQSLQDGKYMKTQKYIQEGVFVCAHTKVACVCVYSAHFTAIMSQSNWCVCPFPINQISQLKMFIQARLKIGHASLWYICHYPRHIYCPMFATTD